MIIMRPKLTLMITDTEIEPELKPIVLVIQDYPPDQLESMQALLTQFGYEVLIANDGQFGLGLAAASPPDLIICDIALPDMSSIELCRKLRAHPKLGAIPFLLISGLRHDSDPVRACFNAGATEYLKMPYEPLRLLAKTVR